MPIATATEFKRISNIFDTNNALNVYNNNCVSDEEMIDQ